MTDYKLVPVKMTDEIRNAIYMALHYDMSVMNPDEWGAVDKAYAAMLEAAPQPAKQQPAPDVTALVEARELLLIFRGAIGGATWTLDDEDKELAVRVEKAVTALATHKDSLTVQPNPPDVAGLVEALTMARETIAAALRANAPDYFTTDADIARHVAIQPIDTALSVFRKGGSTDGE